jgi:hypothetical protein
MLSSLRTARKAVVAACLQHKVAGKSLLLHLNRPQLKLLHRAIS